MNEKVCINPGMPPIHIFWDQGFHSAPDLVQRIVKLWQKAAPNRNINLYSGEEANDMLLEYGLKLNTLQVALKSDIFRLLLLEKYGGLWVDATLLPTPATQEWLQELSGTNFFMFRDPGPDRVISSWLIYSVPDNALIREWRKSLINLLVSNSTKSIDRGSKLQKAIIYSLVKFKPSLVPHPFVQSLVRAYPYFITHYIFDRIVRTVPDLSRAFNEMPYVNADQSHQILRFIRRNPELSDSMIKSLFDASPVHKLTWKEGDLYERVVSIAENSFIS